MRQATVLAAIFSSACLFGQTPPPAFEVASVKPAAPQGDGRNFVMRRGGPGTQDPSQVTYTNASLMTLISTAWDIKNFQITAPSWLESEHYDVSAKVPPGTTKEQMRLMLQRLLAERFHLVVHHETKDTQGYELVVGKNGSKLKPSSPEDAALADQPPTGGTNGPPGPPRRDANGALQLDRPGLAVMVGMGAKGPLAHMTAKAQKISDLTNTLSNEMRRPVVDKTGLTDRYDFTLEYAPDPGAFPGGMPLPPPPPGAGLQGPPPGSDESGPVVITAIQEQLGLRLDSKKVPIDIIVVDIADKVPTEN